MSETEVKPSKVAIIGCGQMARVHARLLKKHLSLDNIAACDTDDLRLREFGKMTGITHLFSNLGKLLNDFEPTVVHIVTPPHTHKNLAIICLGSGCDVLIEKPMCLTSADADEIIAVARQCNRMVCVDHMRSLDPLTLKARRLIEKRNFGQIINVSVHYSYDYLQRVDSDPAARWIKTLPGGSFFDLMPHVLCLLRDFLPYLKLESKLLRFNDEDVLTDLQCVFSSDLATGHLHMTLRSLPLKNFIEIECERGIVRVDFRNFLVTYRCATPLPNFVERILGNLGMGWQYLWGTTVVVSKALTGRLDPYAGLDAITRDLLKASQERGRPPVDGTVAKQLLEITESLFVRPVNQAEEQSETPGPADVLVTGGTGFIGRPLVKKLLQKGLNVRILTHRPLKAEQIRTWFGRDVDVVRGNIYDPKDVLRAMDGVKKVYHLAAAMKGDWTNHLDTTITGTSNVLRAAEAKGVKDIVYMSTLNVYDASHYPEDREINEAFPDEPHPERRGSYSHAKLMAEKEVRAFAADHPHIRISVFRPGLVYGPGGNPFSNDVGLRIGKKWVVVFGLGLRKLPLVYVENVVDALVAETAPSETSIHFFNVVDRDYPDQRKYIRVYRLLTGEDFFVIYTPLYCVMAGFWCLDMIMRLVLRKRTSFVYKLRCISASPRHSTANAEKRLGWRQKVSFEEGLKSAVNIG